MRERALSDEAAFLGAVRANPGDDTAWFAFADWLDARDDSQGGRVSVRFADLAPISLTRNCRMR
ncbi:TIGR02996 domain-containing protein [Gemmata obscuriglobus]|uniref:TIGR02996 domain-containing protein n=1 Tax=Gemmata obscuriglobus TaxID=114 RepID=A0A2Z3H4F7_9BACT|nr:TIGR02996 domain-containing protein [Gemmata obscuriglobus]